MAMANNFQVSEICIEENEFGRGYTKYGLPEPLKPISRKGAVLTLAAGLAADFVHARFCGVDAGEMPLGYQNDRVQAEEHLRELGEDGEFDIYLSVAVKFVSRMDVWCHVDFLAKALLEVRKINDREILTQLFKKVPNVGKEDFDLIQLVQDSGVRLDRNI